MNGNRSQKIGLQILKFANHNHQSISTWKSNKRFARLSGGTFVPGMNCENVIDLQWCCLIPYIISYYRVCSTIPWVIHPIFLCGWLVERGYEWIAQNSRWNVELKSSLTVCTLCHFSVMPSSDGCCQTRWRHFNGIHYAVKVSGRRRVVHSWQLLTINLLFVVSELFAAMSSALINALIL